MERRQGGAFGGNSKLRFLVIHSLVPMHNFKFSTLQVNRSLIMVRHFCFNFQNKLLHCFGVTSLRVNGALVNSTMDCALDVKRSFAKN